MGIYDRTNPCTRIVQLADLNAVNNATSDTSDDASSVASDSVPQAPPAPRRTKNVKAQAIDYQTFANRLHSKSRRFSKRQNQLNYARALIGLEETDIESDFTLDEYGRSAFSSLFAEAQHMKAWNKFIQLSEEEQAEVIENRHQTAKEESYNDSIGSNNNAPSPPSADKRASHPAFSCKESFSQISQNIQTLLKKRHLPLGLIDSLEAEIRLYFEECAFAMFEPDIGTSFGRLIVHAICQYLKLESISFNVGNTRKMTIVNKCSFFDPPPMLLSEYIEFISAQKL